MKNVQRYLIKLLDNPVGRKLDRHHSSDIDKNERLT